MTVRALLLVDEPKDQGCHHAYNLYAEIELIEGVLSAYPLLGRIDGSVWIEGPDLEGVTKTIRAVQALPGVRASKTLLEAPLV